MALHIAHNAADQPALEADPNRSRRFFNDGTEFRFTWRRNEHDALADKCTEFGVPERSIHVVGTHGEEDPNHAVLCACRFHEEAQKRAPIGFAIDRGEQFLELVDDQ